jgi:DNA repair exonuclease SbcCD nuclease subunit
MKLLVTADWHADQRSLGHARFGDVDRAVRQMVSCAADEACAAFLFLGDLCNPDGGSGVVRCCELAVSAALALQRAGVDSFWLAGNHDVIEDGSRDTSLSPLRPLASAKDSLVHVFEQPGVAHLYELGGKASRCVTFLALPFTATSHPYRPEGFVREKLEKVRPGPLVVMSHLSVGGVQPGEETTDMPRGRDVLFPHECFPQGRLNTTLLQGHYHAAQVFRRGGLCDVVIPGAPVRLTFADEQRKPSFVVLEV